MSWVSPGEEGRTAVGESELEGKRCSPGTVVLAGFLLLFLSVAPSLNLAFLTSDCCV